MALLCGIDFTEHSTGALRIATALAARMGSPLHLVHALEPSPAGEGGEELRRATRDFAERELRKAADTARARGVQVEEHLGSGPPDEVLLEAAQRASAKLIVVAALGRRRESQWRLGSHAERLAQRSRIPVLVVRAPEALEAWAQGTAPLRVVLGADASLSSEQAMQWIGGLLALGPCEVTAVHLYWPPEQFRRLGLHGVRSYLEPAPEVTNALERDLGARFANLSGAPQSKLRCEPHIGRIGDRLAAVAAEVGAQLLVVGSHPRTALDRMAEGSVSRDVLHCAGMSVACVPLPADARMGKTPDLNDVLVATDFSPTADAAVPLAYAIAPRGSTVHVVHVTRERTARPLEPHDIFSAGAHPEERAQLAALVPADATERGVLTELHVLQSNDIPEAICQAAERLNARVLCLGTHGRSGLSKVVLGSVAQKVVAETRRPVLLARRPVE